MNNQAVDLRNFNVELQKMELCLPDCKEGRHNVRIPMVPCGLCDNWYHIQCLGLPAGTPRSIRGLYFCQDCLGALREMRWMARRNREREARFEAMEATVATLELEQSQLKEHQQRTDSLTALAERVIKMGVTLIKDNAQLRRELMEETAVQGNKRNLEIERAEAKRTAEHSSIVELQRLIASSVTDDQQKSAKTSITASSSVISYPTSSMTVVPYAYKKRKFLSTFTASLKHQDDDNYIYCDECQTECLHSCQLHGPMNRMLDTVVSDLDPLKAEHSLPPNLVLRKSALPGAGMGVFTTVDLPKGQVFGPFVGKLISADSTHFFNGDYCWKLRNKMGRPLYVDGSKSSESNWMRYVNSANFEAQRNLVALQYKGQIYYRAIKPLLKQTELLVWYGVAFASPDSAPTPTPTPPQIYKQITGVTTNGKQISGYALNKEIAGPSKAASSSSHLGSRLIFTPPNVTYEGPSVSAADRKFHCHVCNTSFTKVHQLNVHQQSFHGIEAGHWCHPCGLQFKEQINLQDHNSRKHGTHVSSTPQFASALSTATIPAAASTQSALSNKPESVRCTSCQFLFASRSQLMFHLRSNLCRGQAKPQEAAAASTSGTTHQTYAIQKPRQNYQCPYCKAEFVMIGYLSNHQNSKHPNMPKLVRQDDGDDASIAWSYQCEFCPKIFPKEATKKRHMAQCQMKQKISEAENEADAEPETTLLDGEVGDWNTLSEEEKAQLQNLGYSLDAGGLVTMQDWNGAGPESGEYPDATSGDFVLQVDAEQPMDQDADSSGKAVAERDEDDDQDPFTPICFVDTQIDTAALVTLD